MTGICFTTLGVENVEVLYIQTVNMHEKAYIIEQLVRLQNVSAVLSFKHAYLIIKTE